MLCVSNENNQFRHIALLASLLTCFGGDLTSPFVNEAGGSGIGGNGGGGGIVADGKGGLMDTGGGGGGKGSE